MDPDTIQSLRSRIRMDLLPCCEGVSMIPVDLSENCAGWIFDPNGSWIQIRKGSSTILICDISHMRKWHPYSQPQSQPQRQGDGALCPQKEDWSLGRGGGGGGPPPYMEGNCDLPELHNKTIRRKEKLTKKNIKAKYAIVFNQTCLQEYTG